MDLRRSGSYRLLASVVLLAAASGCAKLDLKPAVPFSMPWEEKPQVPDRVVAFWTDTILYQSNQPPIRGFGGRLMFYGPGSSKPIKVDGELVVYAFDEEGRDPTDVKPDRKYVFPAEQFAKHYSKSKLGHSYSVWIPWDEAGGPQKEISLIVRFVPKEGPVIVGEQSRQLLPGPSPPNEPAASSKANEQQRSPDRPASRASSQSDSSQASGVHPAAYETSASADLPERHSRQSTGGQEPAEQAPQRMTTLTIDLPPRFSGQARLQAELSAGRQPRENRLNPPGSPTAPAEALPRTGFPSAAQHPRAWQPPLDSPPPSGGPMGQQSWAATAPMQGRPQRFELGARQQVAEPEQQPRYYWQRPTLPRSTHYSPPRFPVRARPDVRPTDARALWQPPR